ncbi:6684_t:CDS:2, partial [Scutellospora calospora]
MVTGDISAAETTDQTKIDERIKIALDLGDPEIVVDLRKHNGGRPSKYEIFWRVAAKFLEGKAANAVTAVDERRHDPIVHLATAISVNNLLYQIEKECPTRTPILAHNVQTRQLRAYHQDTHYVSALYRYKKEFAVKFRKITNFVFMDDKHRCKVGEPEFPVAAVERGKKVVVSRETTFAVADHDYTKTGIIPSITIICNIPESINRDFYTGKPILCLYTDGSPDHHCTYTRIQLSYICLFLALDLDYFVA